MELLLIGFRDSMEHHILKNPLGKQNSLGSVIFSHKPTLNCIHTALEGCETKQLDFNCEKMSNLVSKI